MPLDWSTLTTAIIGGGVASALVNAATLRKDSREARSSLLTPMTRVESGRWCGRSDGADLGWQDFLKVARDFQAAAIVTGVRQDVTETYLAYCVAAYRYSADDAEHNPDPDLAGSVPTRLSDAAESLAMLVSDSAWKPLRTNFRARSRIAEVNAKFDSAGSPLLEWEFTPWRRHHSG